MATVRSSLEFSITAAYLGKPAMEAARKDFLETRTELQKLADEAINIRVKLSGLDDDIAEIKALTSTPQDVHLHGVADTKTAEGQLNETARFRPVTMKAVAETADAVRDLDQAAHDRTVIIRYRPENAREAATAADDAMRDRTNVIGTEVQGVSEAAAAFDGLNQKRAAEFVATPENVSEANAELNELAKPRVSPIVAKIEADAASQKRMSDLIAQKNRMNYAIEEVRRKRYVEIDEGLGQAKRDVNERYPDRRRNPQSARAAFNEKSGLESEAKNAKNSARMDELRQKNVVQQWADQQGIDERATTKKTKAGIVQDARDQSAAEKAHARKQSQAQKAMESAATAKAKIDKTAEDRTATIRVQAQAGDAKAAIDDVAKRRKLQIDLDLKNAKDELDKAFPGKRPMEIQTMITSAKDNLDFAARNKKLDIDQRSAGAKRDIDRAVATRQVAVYRGENRDQVDADASRTISTIKNTAATGISNAQFEHSAQQREAVITAKADTAEARAQLDEVAKARTARVDTDSSGLDGIKSAADKATKSVKDLASAMALVSLGSAALGAVMTTGLAAGVIAAGGAAIAVNKRLAASHKEAMDAAQLQAETAKRDLAQAYRDVADTAIESSQRIAAAQHEVQMADRNEEDARRSLTEAYRDARQELEDLQLQLEQAPINQRSADIGVARAYQNLTQLGKRQDVTPLDYEDAFNQIDEAKAHQDEVRVKNQQLQDNAAVAAKKGVEGNDKVIKGKEALADADYQQKVSQQDLVNTQRETAEAQLKAAESVKVALQEQARANSELAKATKDANSAMSQMSAMFADLAAPLQGPLHNAMQSLKQQFMDMKPVIQQGFQSAADYVQPFTDALTGLMLGPVPGVVTALQNSQPAVTGFRDGMRSLGTDIGTMFSQMSAGSAGFGDLWRSLGDQVGKFLIQIGTFIGQYAGPASQALSTLLQGVNDLAAGFLNGLGPGMKDLPVIASAIASVMKDVGQIIGILVQSSFPAIIAIAPIIKDLATGFAAVMNWLQPMLPILAPLAAGWFLLDAALDLNPFVLIAGAIAGVAAGIGYLATQTKVFQDIWNKMPKGVQEFGAAVVNDTKKAGGAVASFATKKDSNGQTGLQKTGSAIMHAGSSVGGAVVSAGKSLGKTFAPELQDMKATFGGIWSSLKAEWDKDLKPAFDSLWSSLKVLWNNSKPILDFIGGAFVAIGKVVMSVISGVIGPIIGVFVDTIKNIVNAVRGLIMMISGFFETVKGVFEICFNFFKTIFGLLKGVFTGDFSTFKSGLDGIGNGFKDMLSGLGTFFAGVWHLVTSLFGEVIDILKGAWKTVEGIVLGIVNGIIHWFEWLYDEMVGHSIIPDLVNDVIKWFESLPDKLIKLVEDLGKKIADAFTKLWGDVKDIASKAWDALKNDTGIGSFVDGIKGTFSGLLKDIGDIWDGIKKVFATPINWVIGIWNNDIVGKIPGLGKIDTIPGYASGGQPDGSPGYINGTGGSREDKHVVAVSNREYIVNAEATSRNRAVLDAMNFGGERAMIPGFALGGTPAHAEAEVPGFSLGGIAFRHMRKAAGLRFADGGPTDGSTNPAIARALQWAAGYQGRPYNDQGWLDCSGLASGIYDSLLGRTPKREFTTTSDFTALGFVPGRGGIMEIGVTPLPGNYGHMATTLAGHKLESGGVHDDIRVDGPAIGADDSQFADHYYLPGKFFNPAYSGAGADGDKGSGGGFFGMIGSAFQAVVGGVRSGISDLFQKLTDPVLNAIPDPMIGGQKGFLGSFPKQIATKSRDDIANLIRGHESTNTIGGAIPTGDRLAVIDAALALTHTPPPGTKEQWEAGMNTLVERESGWNTGAINDWDDNAKAGNPSKGLAQTTGTTFAAFAAPGHKNIFEGVDNLAASINYIKSKYGGIDRVQQANANMPPKGYATGTTNAKKGWSLVGELGPELVLFGGGETVIPNNMLGNLNDNWNAAAQANGLGLKAQSAGQAFAKANFDQFVGDLGGSTSGDGLAEAAFTQVPSYLLALDAYQKSGKLGKPAYQTLSNQIQGDLSKPPANPLDPGQEGVTTQPGTPPPGAQPQQQQNQNPLSQFLHPTEVHFHVSDVDEAMGKWKQTQREATLGFDPLGIFGS
ncbi:hypothetical protein [Nocardia jiangxiensis]|uniref:hypothetical protein n=1 Tax=Nocardia jiangxiensis TaxID=282685 RepID=UPI000303F147|nr:hypothetical protein [Nocardia jiangxiensis]